MPSQTFIFHVPYLLELPARNVFRWNFRFHSCCVYCRYSLHLFIVGWNVFAICISSQNFKWNIKHSFQTFFFYARISLALCLVLLLTRALSIVREHNEIPSLKSVCNCIICMAQFATTLRQIYR